MATQSRANLRTTPVVPFPWENQIDQNPEKPCKEWWLDSRQFFPGYLFFWRSTTRMFLAIAGGPWVHKGKLALGRPHATVDRRQKARVHCTPCMHTSWGLQWQWLWLWLWDDALSPSPFTWALRHALSSHLNMLMIGAGLLEGGPGRRGSPLPFSSPPCCRLHYFCHGFKLDWLQSQSLVGGRCIIYSYVSYIMGLDRAISSS
jgi:hypothetical protein